MVGQEDRAARFGGYFEHVLCIAIENMYLCVPVVIFCSMYDFRFGGYFEHVLCIASVVPLNLQQNMYLGVSMSLQMCWSSFAVCRTLDLVVAFYTLCGRASEATCCTLPVTPNQTM